MKAAIYTRYGSPNVIQIGDVEKPAPKDNEVLIKVRAASVNPYDWHFMRGEPYAVRIAAGGLRKPKDPRLGADLAGVVEAVGRNVTQFRQGDEVFGVGRGAFAEYACAREGAVAKKPEKVTFEQAAAVPIAGFTALQGLRDKGHVQQGQKVLVNGAAGGVGTFGVQIGKWFGANVTGVCSTRNVEMVRSIGADHVIDYTKENFARGTQRYDLILDAVGNHPFSECKRILSVRGIFVGAGGKTDNWMVSFFMSTIKAQVMSLVGSQKGTMVLAKFNQKDLNLMGELIATGKVTPVIDRCYELSEVAEAIRYLEEGHARGKVVVIP